mmetsp:Transcript_5334/g.15041  ORF Transcript_5334/g.15041 Transcript_5334/m.15041 type:complete len:82 (+) Transcript_5334:604-849(+)
MTRYHILSTKALGTVTSLELSSLHKKDSVSVFINLDQRSSDWKILSHVWRIKSLFFEYWNPVFMWVNDNGVVSLLSLLVYL